MSLSDKRQDTNKGTDFVRFAYSEEAVKECIRLIKHKNTWINGNGEEIISIGLIEFNKLTGPKLT